MIFGGKGCAFPHSALEAILLWSCRGEGDCNQAWIWAGIVAMNGKFWVISQILPPWEKKVQVQSSISDLSIGFHWMYLDFVNSGILDLCSFLSAAPSVDPCTRRRAVDHPQGQAARSFVKTRRLLVLHPAGRHPLGLPLQQVDLSEQLLVRPLGVRVDYHLRCRDKEYIFLSTSSKEPGGV